MSAVMTVTRRPGLDEILRFAEAAPMLLAASLAVRFVPLRWIVRSL